MAFRRVQADFALFSANLRSIRLTVFWTWPFFGLEIVASLCGLHFVGFGRNLNKIVYYFFGHTKEVGEKQRAHPTGEGRKVLGKMHRNLDVEDCASMQK